MAAFPVLSSRDKMMTMSMDNVSAVRTQAAAAIQRVWESYRNRKLFAYLKDIAKTSESTFSFDLLKKINAREAELARDPTMNTCLRFRFGGADFPPRIYYKIFSRNMNVVYLSGKTVLLPCSNGAKDSLKQMGHQRFQQMVVRDAVAGELFPPGISNSQDFQRTVGALDRFPIRDGGRGNKWREISYDRSDVHNFTQLDLEQEMEVAVPEASVTAKIDDKQPLHEIGAHGGARTAICFTLNVVKKRRPSHSPTHKLARSSAQRKRKALQMFRLYSAHLQDEAAGSSTDKHDIHNLDEDILVAPFEKNGTNYGLLRELQAEIDDDWESEVDELYEWTEKLDFEEYRTSWSTLGTVKDEVSVMRPSADVFAKPPDNEVPSAGARTDSNPSQAVAAGDGDTPPGLSVQALGMLLDEL